MSSGTGFSGFTSFLDFSHWLKIFQRLVFNPLASSDSCCSVGNLKRDDALEAIGRHGWSLLEFGWCCSKCGSVREVSVSNWSLLE